MILSLFPKKKVKKTNDFLEKESKELKSIFEDHLLSINENTQEIQSNYEHILKLDSRINKIEERLEQIQIMLKKLFTNNEFVVDKPLQPLSMREKEIFLVLYTSPDPLPYREIAKITNLTDSIIREYISSLIQKGVPLKKEYICDKPFVYLDKKFKDLQAKENILNLTLQEFV